MKWLKTVIKFPHTHIYDSTSCKWTSTFIQSHFPPKHSKSKRCHSLQMIEFDTLKVHDSLKINPYLKNNKQNCWKWNLTSHTTKRLQDVHGYHNTFALLISLEYYSQFSVSIFYWVYSYHVEHTQFKLFIIVKLKTFLCLIPPHKNV
jgi:hypothetical protein